jgi:uncharacterized hydrophobic protein (TIGR00271 family)
MKDKGNMGLFSVLRWYFDAFPDKEDEQETIDQIKGSVDFRGANLWILIFAIFIASLGLNVNSTAVIIGAMLISPLMGPIIGIGLSIGISDLELLKRSFKNYAVATVISVLTATIYFLITPLNEAQSELLARTSPTLYDVLIALCGGAAGILALSTKGKGNVIPGVAIATALMPPLCTAGYGLAMGQPAFFFGAFYLFFINTVFICLATYLGVRLLKFRHKVFNDAARLRKVKHYIIGVVIVTMLPATYMTVRIIRASVLENNARNFIRNELVFKGTQIISEDIDIKNHRLNIVAVGKQIERPTIDSVAKRLTKYRLAGYSINVIQGAQSDSVFFLKNRLNTADMKNENSNKRMLEQSAKIRDLEEKLMQYATYEDMSHDVLKEAKVVYPQIDALSLAMISEWKSDSATADRYPVAIVNSQKRFNTTDRAKFQAWLMARLKVKKLRLIITP